MQVDGFSSRIYEYPVGEFLSSCTTEDYLGSGSFASARRCYHEREGTIVVKCFQVTGADKAQQRKENDIKREANILVSIDHPNIIRIFGVTLWSSCVGIVMEFAQHDNLDSLLFGEITDVGWSIRMNMSLGILSGLSYLHHNFSHKSYCHGDLKSENILLNDKFEAKIGDFGSANLIRHGSILSTETEVTPSTQFTLYYCAPEFSEEKDPEPSMDMYSVGMIIYEIVTRTPIYDGVRHLTYLTVLISRGTRPNENLVEKMQRNLSDKDFRICEILKLVMVQCWNGDSSKRPDSKSAMIKLSEKAQEISITADLDSEVSVLKMLMEAQNLETSATNIKGALVSLEKFTYPFKEAPFPQTNLPDDQSASTSLDYPDNRFNQSVVETDAPSNPGIQTLVQGMHLEELKLDDPFNSDFIPLVPEEQAKAIELKKKSWLWAIAAVLIPFLAYLALKSETFSVLDLTNHEEAKVSLPEVVSFEIDTTVESYISHMVDIERCLLANETDRALLISKELGKVIENNLPTSEASMMGSRCLDMLDLLKDTAGSDEALSFAQTALTLFLFAKEPPAKAEGLNSVVTSLARLATAMVEGGKAGQVKQNVLPMMRLANTKLKETQDLRPDVKEIYFANYYVSRSQALLALKEYETAHDIAQQACDIILKIHGDEAHYFKLYGESLYLMGSAQMSLGDTHQAKTNFEQSMNAFAECRDCGNEQNKQSDVNKAKSKLSLLEKLSWHLQMRMHI